MLNNTNLFGIFRRIQVAIPNDSLETRISPVTQLAGRTCGNTPPQSRERHDKTASTDNTLSLRAESHLLENDVL